MDPHHRHRGTALRGPGPYWELALEAYAILLRENPCQGQAWGQVVRLMVRHGAPIRRRTKHRALWITQGVRSAGEGWNEGLCGAREAKPRLMKREA